MGADAAYLEAIEAALLTHTGRGLMLSALDMQYVHRWARAGVPIEVVLGGLEAAFENNPRTTRGLAYAAKAVDKAIAAWNQRRVGGRDAHREAAAAQAEVQPAIDRLLKRIADAGLRHQPAVRLVLRDVYRQIRAINPLGDPVGALAAIAESAHDALWDVLDAATRADLIERIESAGVSPTRARRWRAVRTHLNLPALALDLGGGW